MGHGHCQECGRRVRGQHPLLISKAFEVGTVHFGPRLLAFAAFQKMICGVSYDKIRLGFEQMLGFPVARSTLCRAMQRLARRAKPTRDALVEALRASPVVYADETGWKQGGRRVWLWVFTNLRETVYEILPGRGFEQAASVLGKNYAGTLGVDGWAPYRCFKEATLQTCYNHLLHRCHELLETATRGAVRFPRLVKAILRHALALRDRRDAGEISPHGLRVAKGLLQAKMNRLLHGRFTNPANQRFAKHLRRYRDNLFVFLDRADVEATNYPAEQDIRIAVVNRKTCGGGNRTAKGAQAQSILMSVLQSCPSQRDPRDRHRHVNPSCSRQHPRPLGQPRAVNNYTPPYSPLLMPQRRYRRDPCRPSGRYVACEKRHDSGKEGHGDERYRIVGVDTEEKSRHDACCRERAHDAEHETDGDQAESLAHDEAEDIRRPCAESHANADLVRSLADIV